MTITYSVDTSFGLHQANGTDYIQSQKFSAKIKHTGLKNLLTDLLSNNIAIVTQTQLAQMANDYQIDKTALQDFLVNQTGLLKVNINQERFQHLAIIGDNEVATQLAAAFTNQFGLSIQHYSHQESIATNNTIIVNYSASYDANRIKALYSNCQQQENYFVTAYLMSDYLIIDNIFSKASGLPCHFCHAERLKQNSKLIPNGQNKSWLSYYREILKENSEALFERKLPTIYNNYITYCLYQFIRRLSDPFCPDWHYDQYAQFWHIHLDKMLITKETASFWPYCQCQNW